MIQQLDSGYLSEGNKNTNLKRYQHPHVHCSIIYNSHDMENNLITHQQMNGLKNCVKNAQPDFLGSTVDKNLPANEHRFNPWYGKIPHATEQLRPLSQLLSLHAATTEAHVPRARAPQ